MQFRAISGNDEPFVGMDLPASIGGQSRTSTPIIAAGWYLREVREVRNDFEPAGLMPDASTLDA